MIWGEETPGTTERFEAKALEPARYLDVEESAVLGLGATEPEADPVAGRSGLVETAASSGRAAWRRRLAPRHRDAVQQFFSSGSAPR